MIVWTAESQQRIERTSSCSCLMISLGQALIHVLLLTANRDRSTATTGKPSKPTPSSSKTLDWLVVGGGLHGVHIGAHLVAKGIENFGIVDDEAELLFKWKRRAEATGMKYMRSSATFHLDVAKDALTQFAADQHGSQGQQNVRGKSKKKFKVKGNSKLFASDYDRPSLELFNRHCDHVIQKYHLDQRHIAGMVENINLADDMVTVTVGGPDPQTLRAKNVVLALGSYHPSRPSWARKDDNQFSHLLDAESTTHDVDTFPSKVAIVGGGVSAVHKALDIVTRNKGSSSSSDLPLVHIISRHDLYEQQFDTHQEWMMDQDAVQRSLKAGGSGFPQRQLDFRQLKSYSERRKVIKQERRAGTVPASLSRKELQDAIRSQRVKWHVGDITKVTPTEDHKTCLQLATKDGNVRNILVDQVLLATGFGTKPPGSDTFLSKLAASENLPLSPHCGYPIVDSKLRWFHPRLFVAGALAELELGPSARNLAGARMVAERIFGDNA